jgi:hypothetical protein
MAIQSPERAAEVINTWFSRHPELVNDSHNAEILGNWIKKNHDVAGELVFTDGSLEIAFRTLASSGQLNFYASKETQNLVAQATQEAQAAQHQLAEAEREKKRKQKELEIEFRREQNQRNNFPGVSSSLRGQAEDQAREQKEAVKREKAIQREQEHRAFREELAAANQLLITNVNGVKWGATNDARAQAKAALRQKYPQFADQIK